MLIVCYRDIDMCRALLLVVFFVPVMGNVACILQCSKDVSCVIIGCVFFQLWRHAECLHALQVPEHCVGCCCLQCSHLHDGS